MRSPQGVPGTENRTMQHLSYEFLEASLDHLRDAPADRGVVVLVVRRPAVGVRELLAEGMLDPAAGLAGDNWLAPAARARRMRTQTRSGRSR